MSIPRTSSNESLPLNSSDESSPLLGDRSPPLSRCGRCWSWLKKAVWGTGQEEEDPITKIVQERFQKAYGVFLPSSPPEPNNSIAVTIYIEANPDHASPVESTSNGDITIHEKAVLPVPSLSSILVTIHDEAIPDYEENTAPPIESTSNGDVYIQINEEEDEDLLPTMEDLPNDAKSYQWAAASCLAGGIFQEVREHPFAASLIVGGALTALGGIGWSTVSLIQNAFWKTIGGFGLTGLGMGIMTDGRELLTKRQRAQLQSPPPQQESLIQRIVNLYSIKGLFMGLSLGHLVVSGRLAESSLLRWNLANMAFGATTAHAIRKTKIEPVWIVSHRLFGSPIFLILSGLIYWDGLDSIPHFHRIIAFLINHLAGRGVYKNIIELTALSFLQEMPNDDELSPFSIYQEFLKDNSSCNPICSFAFFKKVIYGIAFFSSIALVIPNIRDIPIVKCLVYLGLGVSGLKFLQVVSNQSSRWQNLENNRFFFFIGKFLRKNSFPLMSLFAFLMNRDSRLISTIGLIALSALMGTQVLQGQKSATLRKIELAILREKLRRGLISPQDLSPNRQMPSSCFIRFLDRCPSWLRFIPLNPVSVLMIPGAMVTAVFALEGKLKTIGKQGESFYYFAFLAGALLINLFAFRIKISPSEILRNPPKDWITLFFQWIKRNSIDYFSAFFAFFLFMFDYEQTHDSGISWPYRVSSLAAEYGLSGTLSAAIAYNSLDTVLPIEEYADLNAIPEDMVNDTDIRYGEGRFTFLAIFDLINQYRRAYS